MTGEEALDAALLAFVQTDEDSPLRERIAASVAAHDAAIRSCRACSGTGKIVKRAGTIYESDGYRAASQPVADGAEMTCVACGGFGVDLEQVAWVCVAAGYGCRPDRAAEPPDLAGDLNRRSVGKE